MKIIHIVPGSGGGFYCQNCTRDIALVKELQKSGHDVLFVPLYLPIREMDDARDVARAPVFFGAINIYLAQKVPMFRRLPLFFRRWFDAPGLLRWAADQAGTTEAGGLGDLTLSVLEGRHGRQQRELDQLIDWLKTQPRADVVHISNALLLGMAPAIREALGVPVVCSLQDEDTWLDALDPVYRDRCWERIRELSRDVAMFIPVSDSFAVRIKGRLGVPDAQSRTVPIGVDPDLFVPPAAPPETPVLGFLSELTPPHGLDRLVEAFLLLKRRPSLNALRLHITGGSVDSGTPFLRRLHKRIAASGVADDVAFMNAYQPERRPGFLQSVSVLSVPAIRPEAFGLFQLEAMACGVPVCQPNLGGYPEIVEATGGGVIYKDLSVAGLADALYPLLSDRALAARYGQAGRTAVVEQFNLRRMAAEMTQVYREVAER